jgi:hypothetical protein
MMKEESDKVEKWHGLKVKVRASLRGHTAEDGRVSMYQDQFSLCLTGCDEFGMCRGSRPPTWVFSPTMPFLTLDMGNPDVSIHPCCTEYFSTKPQRILPKRDSLRCITLSSFT